MIHSFRRLCITVFNQICDIYIYIYIYTEISQLYYIDNHSKK